MFRSQRGFLLDHSGNHRFYASWVPELAKSVNGFDVRGSKEYVEEITKMAEEDARRPALKYHLAEHIALLEESLNKPLDHLDGVIKTLDSVLGISLELAAACSATFGTPESASKDAMLLTKFLQDQQVSAQRTSDQQTACAKEVEKAFNDVRCCRRLYERAS